MDTVWPTGRVNYRALDSVFFFAATAILASFLSRRAPSSWSSCSSFTLARWIFTSLLLDSLAFVMAAGILLIGVGTGQAAGCSTAVWLCITAYAVSKLLIYFFLVERAFLVWSADTDREQRSRARSPIYRIAFLCLFLCIGTLLAMIFGRVARLRQHDGACQIGLKLFATGPLLAVDALVNVGLTSAFVFPILKSRFSTSRRLAYRSAIAAVGALVTSAANLILVATMKGHQLSWVCLSSCSLDVLLNAGIIFWITSGDPTDPMVREANSTRPSMSYPSSGRGSLAFLGSGKRGSTARSRKASVDPWAASHFSKDYRPSTSPTLCDNLPRPQPVAGRVSFSPGSRREEMPFNITLDRDADWRTVECGEIKGRRPSLSPSVKSTDQFAVV